MLIPLPINTLWYNGDWDLYTGVENSVGVCVCDNGPAACISRPINELLPDIPFYAPIYVDFNVTGPVGWHVTGAFSQDFTFIDPSFLVNLQATYEIRKNVSTLNGGILVASGISNAIIEPTGASVTVGSVIYTEYRFTVTGLNINLPVGKYWVNVAPVIPQAITDFYNTIYIMFNSTTMGVDAVGTPPGNSFNNFFALGNPDPDNTFYPTTSFGQQYGNFTAAILGEELPVCIHPDMEVMLQNGRIKKIRDLRPGDLVMTSLDNSSKPAKVMINHYNKEKHRVLIKITPNSISENVPSKPLLISTNHPIVIDNKYIKPRDLINGTTIIREKLEPINTHTIVTRHGEPIIINGVRVSTWKLKHWKRAI